MCLIAFHWQPGARVPLVVVANRDEFHDRPARALNWWQRPDGVLAGRDEVGGGTWMGVRRDGRFAAVTNFRDPDAGPAPKSRGELPLRWLDSKAPGGAFGERLFRQRHDYGPFNLIYGSPAALYIVGTHTEPAAISPGLHALSNHLLDAPWPKATRAVARLENWLQSGSGDTGGLLDLLDDREPAPEDQLPDTGVGRELESLLSAAFVVSPRYGTRASTALVLDGSISMAERSFDAAGAIIGEHHFRWSG